MLQNTKVSLSMLILALAALLTGVPRQADAQTRQTVFRDDTEHNLARYWIIANRDVLKRVAAERIATGDVRPSDHIIFDDGPVRHHLVDAADAGRMVTALELICLNRVARSIVLGCRTGHGSINLRVSAQACARATSIADLLPRQCLPGKAFASTVEGKIVTIRYASARPEPVPRRTDPPQPPPPVVARTQAPPAPRHPAVTTSAHPRPAPVAPARTVPAAASSAPVSHGTDWRNVALVILGIAFLALAIAFWWKFVTAPKLQKRKLEEAEGKAKELEGAIKDLRSAHIQELQRFTTVPHVELTEAQQRLVEAKNALERERDALLLEKRGLLTKNAGLESQVSTQGNALKMALDDKRSAIEQAQVDKEAHDREVAALNLQVGSARELLEEKGTHIKKQDELLALQTAELNSLRPANALLGRPSIPPAAAFTPPGEMPLRARTVPPRTSVPPSTQPGFAVGAPQETTVAAVRRPSQASMTPAAAALVGHSEPPVHDPVAATQPPPTAKPIGVGLNRSEPGRAPGVKDTDVFNGLKEEIANRSRTGAQNNGSVPAKDVDHPPAAESAAAPPRGSEANPRTTILGVGDTSLPPAADGDLTRVMDADALMRGASAPPPTDGRNSGPVNVFTAPTVAGGHKIMNALIDLSVAATTSQLPDAGSKEDTGPVTQVPPPPRTPTGLAPPRVHVARHPDDEFHFDFEEESSGPQAVASSQEHSGIQGKDKAG